MKLQQPPGGAKVMPQNDAIHTRVSVREICQAHAAGRAADQAAGVTGLWGIARALNERGIQSPRGHGWQATQVRRLLARLEV
jgi:hypothetical protein